MSANSLLEHRGETLFREHCRPDPASIARRPRSILRGYQTRARMAEPQQASTYAEPMTGGCEMIVG
jgi:hypothetical protein